MNRRSLALCVLVPMALVAVVVVFVARSRPSVREKFNQLKERMTYEEVITIMGPPSQEWLLEADQIATVLPSGWISAHWIGKDGAILIVFRGDKQAFFLSCFESESPSFLDRVRSWLGL